MKIRIRENSVRLRLTKTEVDAFCKNGIFKQETSFPNQLFYYTLAVSPDIHELTADFKSNEIRVLMPSVFKDAWEQTDKVGFQNEIKVRDSESLLLKVEKDFVCLDETEEDQSDNYPNPRNA